MNDESHDELEVKEFRELVESQAERGQLKDGVLDENDPFLSEYIMGFGRGAPFLDTKDFGIC